MTYAFFFADGRVERHEVDDEFVLFEVTLADWNGWEAHPDDLLRIGGTPFRSGLSSGTTLLAG